MKIPVRLLSVILLSVTFNIVLIINSAAQFVPVGSGSFTTQFPGVDVAGRNSYPSGVPLVSGTAATKPVPTNDWWSAKLNQSQVNNLFPYPTALRTTSQGLVLSYIPAPSGSGGSSQPMDDIIPLIAGLTGLNASQSTVCNFSDFTVTINWNDGSHDLSATIGLAMPFIYFETGTGEEANVTITEGTVTITGEVISIENGHNGVDYAIYAPVGSTWTKDGTVYTSGLNGKNYFSAAYIPPTAASFSDAVEEYKAYAYVYPVNTLADWQYDQSTEVVRTIFTVETEVKEGSGDKVLLGLLPHLWAHLASDSPVPAGYRYPSIRGEIRTLASNSFIVENTFHGILPTLPYIDYYSEGFNPALLEEKVSLLEDEALATWTDSYNEGQVMNRLIQTARVAELAGDSVALKKIVKTVRDRLEDWLTAEDGEVAFLFYYNSDWSALIGYPAGHGQDYNLNDHHFHWGYFIHAAAFVEQFNPGWAEDWGPMINLLVRDAASSDRNDPMFPYLRNFSPYDGHCWANGFASFPFGNDQESTSESMQFNSSLIHWGEITENTAIRDLGIYLYTTEESAINEYWFDKHERIFKPEYAYSVVSRIWGNGYDNQTFWTSDIAAAYGIELYPVHGGSLYLGADHAYSEKLWNEITENTGILSNAANDNLWHDVMWEYLAFTDPAKAIELYDSYPERSLKFGISDAQTYHWLHSMNALGLVDTTVTADYPLAAVFNSDGNKTYVANNYSESAFTVNFSDGYSLVLPGKGMYTSRDPELEGSITSLFSQAFPGGSVQLEVTVTTGTPDSIVIYDGAERLGTVLASGEYTAGGLQAGVHPFYARLYKDGMQNITNIIRIMVGRQLPYSGIAISLPGSVQAGYYDKFEGGNGQDICYHDASIVNEGGFRPTEYVDAGTDGSEGSSIGWIDGGEWLEYTIDASQSAYYGFQFRYASGNDNGGGPMFLLLDGDTVARDIMVGSTGDWSTFKTLTYGNIPVSKGEHIMQVYFKQGGFNLGTMDFTYSAALDYDQPVANAGPNKVVILPADNTDLDGSASYDPDNASLSMFWTQIYGPSLINFDDPEAASPHISNLVKGVYNIDLEVNNGLYSDKDEILIIVSETSTFPPVISLLSPADGSSYLAGKMVEITAAASDLDGNILNIEFYANGTKIGEASQEPFTIEWTEETGTYTLYAIAMDNDGNSTQSETVEVHFTEPPSCLGQAANGEFNYLFSDDEQNPTLTFIPLNDGVGDPTCLLYYSTSSTPPFPGYNVTPNVPYRLSAVQGSTVYFYYTYSYPNQGEHTTYGSIISYETGTCKAPPSNTTEALLPGDVSCFPNPVKDLLHISIPETNAEISLYDLNGRLLFKGSVNNGYYTLNMNPFAPGIYILLVENNQRTCRMRIVSEE